MRFLCLGYADESMWENLSKSEIDAMVERCISYDDELRRKGHFVDGEALEKSADAKTLRWKDGKVLVTDGPFAETKEQLGGLIVLEARDLNHAIELMSKHPGVHFSPWEIRPIEPQMSAMMKTEPASAESTTKPARKFLCFGYMEENKWDALTTSEQEVFMNECLAYDQELRKDGHWAGGEALQYARTAKTLRGKSGKVVVTDGPYAETKEQLGGLVIILARDTHHAIELMSKSPGIRIGVHLEIRPANEAFNAMIAERRRAGRLSIADRSQS